MSNRSDPLPPPEPEDEEKETYDLFISPEPREKQEAEDADVESDLADRKAYKTKNSDGHTYDPSKAMDQGLTYTPPSDPSVLPSEDDPQGAEVAAGFAPSMEASDPDVRVLPPTVDNSDLNLQENIYLALRNNSETGHLTDIQVEVQQGRVRLSGPVLDEKDIWLVDDLVYEIEGVVAVKNDLQVETAS